MISNELRSPYTRQPYTQKSYPPHVQQQPRQPVQEDTLKFAEIQVERKTYHLMLKQNRQGKFLRISEGNGKKLNSIIIPAPGLVEFKKLFDEMVKASDCGK